jgi:hypothetical protein
MPFTKCAEEPFHLSFLYIKNSVGRVALSKDRLLFGKGFNLSAAADGRKECLGIKLVDECNGDISTITVPVGWGMPRQGVARLWHGSWLSFFRSLGGRDAGRCGVDQC